MAFEKNLHHAFTHLSYLAGQLHLVDRMGLAIHCFLTAQENHADLEILCLLAVQIVLKDQLDREDLSYQVALDFQGNLLVLVFQWPRAVLSVQAVLVHHWILATHLVLENPEILVLQYHL